MEEFAPPADRSSLWWPWWAGIVADVVLLISCIFTAITTSIVVILHIGFWLLG